MLNSRHLKTWLMACREGKRRVRGTSSRSASQSLRLGVLILLASCSSEPTVPATTSLTDVPGTYRFWLCQPDCAPDDSSNAYVVGLAVLVRDSSSLPAEIHANRFWRMMSWDDRPANGCFTLEPVWRANSYAGIQRGGLLSWTFEPDSGVIFSLFRSADAGYRVRVGIVADSLIGRGDSWGAGAADIRVPADFVHGSRLGPADDEICLGLVE